MATLAFDPNKQEQNKTETNVLAPQQQNSGNSGYVSDGNPYGSYAAPSIPAPQTSQNPQQTSQASAANQQASRKQDNSASSGRHTNVQTYVDKNKQSSQQMGQAVEGKLQNTADLVRQNTQNVNSKFQKNVDQGSLQGWETAVDRSREAFNQAAQTKAPTQTYHSNEASRYIPQAIQNDPTQINAQISPEKGGGLAQNPVEQAPQYSAEDQALIDSNMARVIFGDGTSKDFATESEAQTAIDDWNRQNPGYYKYGEQEQLSLSDKELSDILNAKYQGPSELYETQGYGDLFNQVNEAQALQDLAQSNDFKGELLKQTFSNPNREYTRGQQVLDDMLLGQGSVNESLKNKAATLGTGLSGRLQDDFDTNLSDMRALAAQRASDIDAVRTGSRSALDEVALGREGQINERLGEVLENWEKYPDYYRDRVQSELDKFDLLKNNYGSYENLNKLETNLNSAQSNFDASKKAYDDFISNNPNLTGDLASTQKTIQSLQSSINKDLQYYQSNRNSFGKSIQANKARERAIQAQRQLDSLQSQIPLLEQKLQLENNLNRSQNDLTSAQQSYDTNKDSLSALLGDIGLDAYQGFDPNAFNLGLSEMEADMLGIRGGEGIYDLLREGGVDALFRTAEADKNKLISRDEQNQLARLQSIAELANDYGSIDSGINFRNDFTNRDAAGTQTALDALDTNFLRDQLQGREKQFRDDVANTTLTGVGHGKGTSKAGISGSTTKRHTTYLDQDLSELFDDIGFRNIYGDEGVDQQKMDQILGLAKGLSSGEYAGGGQDSFIQQLNNIQSGLTLGSYLPESENALNNTLVSAITAGINPLDYYNNAGQLTSEGANRLYNTSEGAVESVFGKDTVVSDVLNAVNPVNYGARAVEGIGNLVTNAAEGVKNLFGGSQSSKAKAKAVKAANANAVTDLQNKINQWVKDQGVANQFSVNRNLEQDAELLQLLGMLDTTNR